MSTMPSHLSNCVPESLGDTKPLQGQTEDILLPSSVKGQQSIPSSQSKPTGSKIPKTVVKRTTR